MTDDETGGALVGDLYGFHDLLDADEAGIVDRLREVLRTEISPVINDYWMRGEFPFQIIEKLAPLGLPAMGYDACAGPTRSSLFRGFASMEMAHVDASISTFYGVHAGLAMGSIAQLGSAEQRERWLPAMGRMELIGAFALTEPQGGSDVAAGMQTTCRRDGGTWVLNGAKRWIGNATFADLTIVWARAEDDPRAVHGFVVEKDTPGFVATRIENKIALRVAQNADIALTDVRVPEDNRLAHADGFHDTAKVLRVTRTGVAWEACGVMLAAYELARDYSVTRQQFGRPIARFQLVQDLLVRMLGNATASLAMCVRLAQLEDRGIRRDEQSALAKAYTTTRMREAVGWARELFAGNGIVLDYDIGRFVADAEALYSYEGTREINSLIVGRAATGESAFV